ncbi:MAG: cytochrome c oxidase subunit 4 [Ktedonobacteraceae bacterium]
MSEKQNQNQQIPGKERPAKAARELSLRAYKSYWPLALALALCVVLLGIIINPIVLGVGVVLTAAAVIGWGLEQR